MTRVAVISTGWISSATIRAIPRRIHLDLAGVWAHSADKTGRDTDDIVGPGTIGVATTHHLVNIVAPHPDWHPSGDRTELHLPVSSR